MPNKKTKQAVVVAAQRNRQQTKKTKTASTIVNAPVAKGTRNVTIGPKINGGSSVRIVHKELVGSVSNGASTTFVLDAQVYSYPGQLDANPGNAMAFPWLSLIAHSFEKWRFNRLKWTFVSRNPTSDNGTIYACFDYDYNDPVSNSAQSMMSNRGAVSAPIWAGCELVVDCAKMNEGMPWRYVDMKGRSSMVDPRLSYGGYGMVGFQTTVAWTYHDVWVEYDVLLDLPSFDFASPLLMLGGGYIPLASVVEAEGTKYVRSFDLPASTVTGVRGPVNSVTVGSPQGPPATTIFTSGSTAGHSVIDFTNMNWRGTLDLFADVILTGKTPEEIELMNTRFLLYALDAAGRYLGEVTYANSGLMAVQGAKDPLTLATADAPWLGCINVALEVVRRAYPSVTYLLPFVSASVAATIAGSLLPAYRFTSPV